MSIHKGESECIKKNNFELAIFSENDKITKPMPPDILSAVSFIVDNNLIFFY